METPEKDLLQVRRFMKWNSNYIRTTTRFKVYKLDFSGSRWVRLKGIGNISLFLGDNSSISVLASNFKGRVKPNSIYFTYDLDTVRMSTPSPSDLGIYDIERKKFEFRFTMDDKFIAKMSKQPPIWFIPTLY